MYRLAFALLAAPFGLGHPPPDHAAWYDIGHRMVARIAESRLSPHTRAAVQDLLGGESLADASLWADQVRPQRPETAPLHYVNIPLAATDYQPARDCPHDQCIVAAIGRDRQILRDSSASHEERAEALRFLIHLIGDLHQPLHVSDNDDRGGNGVKVDFLGTSRNLHQVWDGELIFASGRTEDQYFSHLREVMTTLDLDAMEEGTVVSWAMEGHLVARTDAYRLPGGNTLGESYLKSNLPVVDLALIKAGVRLAGVLNRVLALYQPRSGSQAAPATAGPTTADTHTYPDRDAAKHIGDSAVVVGTVVSVYHSRAGNTFLNFGAAYPNQTFSGAILNARGAWPLTLDTLVGKRVGIRGVIRLYRGKPEILIEEPGQIVAAGAKP